MAGKSALRAGWTHAVQRSGSRTSDNLRGSECAPVAQLDRAIASGAIGREFESLRARQHLLSHAIPAHPRTFSPFHSYPIVRGRMFSFLLWCILLVICWPLALLALVAYPFVWLLLLPFRLLGI